MASLLLWPARGVPAAIEAGPALPATLQIRNVVASVRVAGSLRLDDLAATIPRTEYDRRVFRLIIRIAAPKATALVFHSGKVVLTGLHDPEAVRPALEGVLEVLRGAGAAIDEPVPAPAIANLVASGTLGREVALHHLAISRHLDRIEFDPEQFPGLVFRSEGGGVALVFGTGSVVVTGVRSLEGARAVATEVDAMVPATSVLLPKRTEHQIEHGRTTDRGRTDIADVVRLCNTL